MDSVKSKSILLPLAAAALAFASCSAGETPKTNAATAADAKGQIEAKQSALKTMHDAFLAKLAAQLSPTQVETVKNKMTYNKTPVTFNAYCEIAAVLTEPQKARVLEMLKDARETAMDGRNAEDMSVVYKKFKGRLQIGRAHV